MGGQPRLGTALTRKAVLLYRAGVSRSDFHLEGGCVRHQSFWTQRLFNLSEHLAHLVGFIMQRVCGVASAGLQVCFV